MLVLAVVTLAGIFVDQRVINGAPAWLKPFKFAISIAVHSFTLAWLFTRLPDWSRMRRVVGWTTSILLALELVIIDAQAWRGTTSHFNVSTRLDAMLFFIMGGAILLQTLVSGAVAVALWRQPFAETALGWALRFGMTLTILGALVGPLMTRPTTAQLDEARASGRMPVVGSHSVGGPDGGPGFPLVGWSTRHGDLRIAHFVGLHALQVLPMMAVALRRWRASEALRVKAVLGVTASYASLFVLLLWWALRGRSLVAPDAAGLVAISGWAIASILSLVWMLFGSRQLSLDDTCDAPAKAHGV